MWMYFVCLDNVVLVGNHRDAVGYGAVDPASGTAVVLELARVFQSLASQGITMPHKINKNLSPAVSLSVQEDYIINVFMCLLFSDINIHLH